MHGEEIMPTVSTCHSESPHPVPSLVARNVWSLADRQNQQKRGLSGNSQLPPAKRCVFVTAGKRDSSQGGSSIASTIQGQNYTPSSSLNNCCVANITQRVISTWSATRWQSFIIPSATLGTRSRNPPAPSGTTQTDSTCRVVCSPKSGIASTPTPPSGPENLPTHIPYAEARTIITNPLPTRATERNSEIQAVALANSGGVHTSISGLRQLQHRLIWSLRHDASCICNGQAPAALHVEQTAVYECNQLGDGMLCNAMCCKCICWSPTLADHRDVLEHRNAAKQDLVHSNWGTHNGDLERGMLNHRPTVDITRLNRYQVRAQVDKVQSKFIQSAWDNIAHLYALHRFESAAERLELVDSHLADNKYLFTLAEHVEGGVRSPNPTQRVLKAANRWPAFTLLPGGSNRRDYLHQISPSGE